METITLEKETDKMWSSVLRLALCHQSTHKHTVDYRRSALDIYFFIKNLVNEDIIVQFIVVVHVIN